MEKEVKATRSSNTHIHGMKWVTMASLAYVVTQVHLAVMFHCYATDHLAAPFALSSSSVFCRTDTTTDLEGFYDSVLDFLDDSDEKNDIHELLDWWNW